VGVFLGYASTHGHTLVDRRLYLTESWLADPAKRASPRAAVPADVGFRTKLELAAEMLTVAVRLGHLPCAWVTADAADGDSHDLRRLVAEQGRWYCFEVRGTTEAWTADPLWRVPPASGRAGRPRTRAKPRPGPWRLGRWRRSCARCPPTPGPGIASRGREGAEGVRVRAPAGHREDPS
jgi:SRSO17 transposase